MIQDQTTIRSMTRTSYSRALDKGRKNLQECRRTFFGGVTSEEARCSLSHPSALSFLTRLRVCSYARFVSPFVTPCSLRCPRDSSRQLLVIYLQHGPKGAPGQGPVVGPTGISCSHGLGAPLTYDVPNTRLQGVLLLIGIIDFFLLLSLSLSLSSHAFHWSRLPARSFSLFPIPPALYFRISRETGSSRSSSAAFEQLPDPSRDFIRAMRRKEFKSTKRIYVYTNKYDIYINLFINQDTRYIWFI